MASALPYIPYKTIQRPIGLPDVEIHRGQHKCDAYIGAFCVHYAVVAIDGSVRHDFRGKQREHCGRHVAFIETGEFAAGSARRGTSFQHLYIPSDMMLRASFEHGNARAPRFVRQIADDVRSYDLVARATAVLTKANEVLEQQEVMTWLLDVILGDYVDRGSAASEITCHRAVRRMRDLIRDAYDQELTLDMLASHANLNKFHALRAFKRALGVTPHEYQRYVRVGHASSMLRKGQSIAEVAQALGFCDQSHFTRTFRQLTHITPRQYQVGL
jgi:AraC-like DNA-binding protein